LNSFNDWRLNFLENSVAADYAFGFSASKLKLLRGNPCAATHTLIDNSRLFHESILFVQRKRFLLLNVFNTQLKIEGQTLRKRLKEKVSETNTPNASDGVYNSFDIVGDIAIIKMPFSFEENAKAAAQAILSGNKGVKTVLAQESKISGAYRLRKLRCVGGEDKTCTVHREHGCLFKVDLEKCFFSPRLSGERLRIAQLVKPGETVVNMFAGVGCFSIIIAKKVPTAKVYSIDINPDAVEFMQENIRVNRVVEKVIPILGDSEEIVNGRLQHCADRVLMPLPEKALEYLPCAVSALKPSGGWIHCHCFEHAAKTEESMQNAHVKIAEKFRSLNVDFEVPFSRVVRPVGPNWHQVEVDVHVGC
jgi:tRNA (guanine37-N1)-methyltransferase